MAAATLAQAQSFHVAGTVGRANWSDLDCDGGCDRNTTALRLAGGAWFNRVVGAEAFVMDMGTARSSDTWLDGKLRGRAVGAVALLGWRGERVDVAGKLGLARVQSRFTAAPTSGWPSESKRSNEPVGGMMLAVRATPQLSLRLDVDVMTVALIGGVYLYGRGADVHTLSLGASYAF
jgi:hypothetical protein